MKTIACSLAALVLAVMPAIASSTLEQQEERMMELAGVKCGPFADQQAALTVRQSTGPTGPRFLRDVRSQYFYACLSGQRMIARGLTDLVDSGQIKSTTLDTCIRAVEVMSNGSIYALMDVRQCVYAPR